MNDRRLREQKMNEPDMKEIIERFIDKARTGVGAVSVQFFEIHICYLSEIFSS